MTRTNSAILAFGLLAAACGDDGATGNSKTPDASSQGGAGGEGGAAREGGFVGHGGPPVGVSVREWNSNPQ